MVHWIVHVVGANGYVGIALLMAIQNVVLPLPSEVIMPLGGVLAQRGHLALWGVIAAGAGGTIVGAIPVYAAAHALGEKRIAAWIERHGRWLLLRAGDVQRADQRFRRFGGWAVLLAQLLPGVRGLIALPAGFARMNVALFALATVAGSVIWCTVLALVGQQLGAHYQKIHDWLWPVASVIVGALVVWGVVWVVRRRRRVA